MRTEKHEVKTKTANGKTEVVSTIEVNVFDTIDEAIATLGDATVISLINRQHKADEMNKERAKFRPDTASKKALRQRAIDYCMQDEDLNAQMQQAITQGLDSLYAFLDKVVEQHLS
jgi:hypothetical protein